MAAFSWPAYFSGRDAVDTCKWCGRPADEGVWCALHRADYDAQSNLKEVEHALKFIGQFKAILDELCNPSLTEAMAGAQEGLERKREAAEERFVRTGEALK